MRRPLLDLPEIAPRRRRGYVADERTGRIMTDPAMKDIVPYWLTTAEEVVRVPAAIALGLGDFADGTVVQPTPLVIDDKGPFEVMYSYFEARFASGQNIGQPASNFTVALFDPEGRLVLMNREIHARTMCGGFGDALGAGTVPAAQSAAGRPLVWPETFFIQPKEGAALHVGFRNLDTEAIDVRFVLAGVRYYNPRPFEAAVQEREAMYGDGRVSYPYFYTTNGMVLLEANGVAGDRNRFPMRITDDTDLEIFKMTKFATSDQFLWRIFEKDSGRRPLDNAGADALGQTGIHANLGWGSGEFPFIPFESAYYEGVAKLDLFLLNLSPAQNRIWLTFIGRRIGHVPEWW